MLKTKLLIRLFGNQLIRRANSDSVHIKAPFTNRSISDHRNDLMVPSSTYLMKKNELDSVDHQVVYDEPNMDALSQHTDQDFINSIGPAIRCSFNLASFVDRSYTLQQLVKLGVDLSQIEANRDATELIMKLDFETDCKPYIRFLHDHSIPKHMLGYVITKNPFLFEQHLEDLEIRIKYLISKKFSRNNIKKIILGNPLLLNYQVKLLDAKLGFIQKIFQLPGGDVRGLLIRHPRVILFRKTHLQSAHFMLREEMGFEVNEIKTLILKAPHVIGNEIMPSFRYRQERLQVFDFVHDRMGLPHELLSKSPQILLQSLSKLKERDGYLKILGKDQYDPTKPCYVSPQLIAIESDQEFCEQTNTFVEDFNLYLKTL